MSYELEDYQGNRLALTSNQAAHAASEAGLLEITVNGQTHYVNKANIASIKPVAGNDRVDAAYRLERPNFRGQASPAKEALREQLLKN